MAALAGCAGRDVKSVESLAADDSINTPVGAATYSGKRFPDEVDCD